MASSYSDSDSEGNLVVVDDSEVTVDNSVVDDSICPVCKGTTYVGETISCETCQYWFHFDCVGVKHSDPFVQREDVPYFCPGCKSKSSKSKKKKKKSSPKKSKKTKNSKSPPIKLKICIGGKRNLVASTPLKEAKNPVLAEEDSKKRKRKKSQDEEERWLDAVESGNLQAVDEELKSIRDPKLMTARQRAMVVRKGSDLSLEEEGHMALEYYKEKAPFDQQEHEENLRQKAIKSAKRKEMEMEKRELDKKKTMERLLYKKDSSKNAASTKNSTKNTAGSSKVPQITYKSDKNGFSLTFPNKCSTLEMGQKQVAPPIGTKCSVQKCGKDKKYNCSKTGKPICSLQCYKKNIALLIH